MVAQLTELIPYNMSISFRTWKCKPYTFNGLICQFHNGLVNKFVSVLLSQARFSSLSTKRISIHSGSLEPQFAWQV